MKNPQNYKKYYKRWNELINDIIADIKDKMTDLGVSSIDLRYRDICWCVIDEPDFQTQLIAMGIVKTPDNRLIVHYGQHKPENYTDVQFLNVRTILRLFKVFEEAIHEFPPKEFDL